MRKNKKKGAQNRSGSGQKNSGTSNSKGFTEEEKGSPHLHQHKALLTSPNTDTLTIYIRYASGLIALRPYRSETEARHDIKSQLRKNHTIRWAKKGIRTGKSPARVHHNGGLYCLAT